MDRDGSGDDGGGREEDAHGAPRETGGPGSRLSWPGIDQHEPPPEWMLWGFESEEEFLEERRIKHPRGRVKPGRAGLYMRQVNVRLLPHVYRELEVMGNMRGMTPTAMARMLVHLAINEDRDEAGRRHARKLLRREE